MSSMSDKEFKDGSHTEEPVSLVNLGSGFETTSLISAMALFLLLPRLPPVVHVVSHSHFLKEFAVDQ